MRAFGDECIRPNLAQWHAEHRIPREYWEELGRREWLLLRREDGRLVDTRSDVTAVVGQAVEQGGLQMIATGVETGV